MIFEKPVVEFVGLDPSDTISTSGTGGVESCNGATAQQNNCTYYSIEDMEHCGYYDITERDSSAHE